MTVIAQVGGFVPRLDGARSLVLFGEKGHLVSCIAGRLADPLRLVVGSDDGVHHVRVAPAPRPPPRSPASARADARSQIEVDELARIGRDAATPAPRRRDVRATAQPRALVALTRGVGGGGVVQARFGKRETAAALTTLVQSRTVSHAVYEPQWDVAIEGHRPAVLEVCGLMRWVCFDFICVGVDFV